MPNSGVRRYAAALQSLVSAGARDRLARAEEPVVRRLCAGGRRIRTPGPSSIAPLAMEMPQEAKRTVEWPPSSWLKKPE